MRETALEVARQEERNTPNKSDIRSAFDRLRALKAEDPDAAAEDVEYWNVQKEIRESMGDDSYQLYAQVSGEKWDLAIKHVMEEYGARLESAEAGQEVTTLSRHFFSKAMQEADKAVEEDPRIKEEFAGREALLREAAAKGLEILWPVFERIFQKRQEELDEEDDDGVDDVPPTRLH